MEYQKEKITRFINFWIDYQKFKGASAICAIFLNFFLLIFKLVFCGIALLVMAPHLAALHLISKKAESKTGNVFRIILYVLCVIISLILDTPFIVMTLVGVVGCLDCLVDAFTDPLLIVPALVCGAIAILFGKITIFLLSALFLKRIPQTIENEEIIEDEDGAETDYEEADEEATPQKISIDAMSGTDFEHFCAEILRMSGYTNMRLTAGSGDQGIDIIAEKDDMKWGFQCKRWGLETHIGNDVIQKTFAGKAFYHCDIAVVITTTFFTRKAEEYARETGVLLWGRNKLFDLVRKTGLSTDYE